MKEPPLEFFTTQHGLDAKLLERILGEALARGGDFADIYVEFAQSTSLLLEESLLKESSEAVSLGAGIRVISGEQTGYAHTNELSSEKLLEAARVAAAIATGAPAGPRGRGPLSSFPLPSRYPSAESLAVCGLPGRVSS